MKRLIALLLVICMTFSLFPMTALAAGRGRDGQKQNTQETDVQTPRKEGHDRDKKRTPPAQTEDKAPSKQGSDDLPGIEGLSEDVDLKFTVTVNNGSGSGQYAAGDNVQIKAANKDANGNAFDHWECSGAELKNSKNQNTSFTMPSNDVTATAVYKSTVTETYYEVVVSANIPGGGIANLTGAGSYKAGDTVTVSAPASVNLDNGKVAVFVDWNYGDRPTTPTMTFTMPDKKVSVVANYKMAAGGSEEEQVTVTFDANGGAWGQETAKTSQVNKGSAVPTAPAAPVREGYTFKGWQNYDANMTVDSDITFKAVWEENPVTPEPVSVTVKVVNGTIDGAAEKTISVDPTKSMKDQLPGNVVADEGYTTVGGSWDKDLNALPAEGDVFTFTCVAAPADSCTYKIIWDANGGAFKDGAASFEQSHEDSSNPKENHEFTLPGGQKPERENYTLLGWSLNPNAEAPDFTGNKYTVDKDQTVTVYAVWEKISETKVITLTYDANGGTGAPEDQSSGEIAKDASYPFEVSAEEPTRTGYEFLGWFTAAEGGEKVGETITCTTDTTIYAQWNQIPETVVMSVRYLYDNDESTTEWVVVAKEFPAGVSLYEALADYVVAKEGYFAPEVWYWSYDTNAKVDENSLTMDAVTMVAKYTSIPDPAVIVNLYKSYDDAEPVLFDSKEVAVGTNLYEALADVALDEDGYTHTQWHLPATPTYTFPGDYTITEQVNVLVKYVSEKPVSYNVVYTDGYKLLNIFPDETYTVLAGSATPEFQGTMRLPKGWTFEGWSPEVADTVTGDVVYTAVYGRATCPKEFTVKYVDGVSHKVIFETQTYKANYGDRTPGFQGDVPQRKGYTFVGWSPAPSRFVTGDVTYVAQWKQDKDGCDHNKKEYTVTYTDGVRGQTVFKDQVYEGLHYGDRTPGFRGTPKRSGYIFKGWAPAVKRNVTGNVTYVAQWERAENHGHHGRPDTTNPRTSDDSHIYLWTAILAVSTVALAGAAVYGLKRKKR